MDNYIPREYKMTYGPMFVDASGLAWIAASDGIYTTDGGSLTKVSENSENWIISGIATMTVMGVPTLFYSTTGSTNNLFSYPIANLTGSDVSIGTPVTTSVTTGGILCMTTDGSLLYYTDSTNTLYLHDSLAGGEDNLGSLTLSSLPTSMCYMNTKLYVNTVSNGMYSIDPISLDVDPKATSSPGHVAVDSFGNIFGAASPINGNTAGLYEYNVSFDGANPQWSQVGTAEIESVGISSTGVGYGIDVTGNVYTITTSESQLASIELTGAATTTTTTTTQPPTTQPPTTQPPSTTTNAPSQLLSSAAWASVNNVVLAIDTTINMSYTFEGISSAYHIDVSGGVLSFTNPTGTTVLQVGSKITLRDGATTHIFTVADLNLTLTNLMTSQFDPTAMNPASTLFKGTSSAFASDISAATLAGISDEAILLEAVIQAHVGNDTGIYSILPDFYSGTTVSIASTDISGVYALLEQKGSTLSTAQKAKGMDICVPDKTTNTIAISTLSTNNVMLPIDLNSQLTYPLSLSPGNFPGYSITVDANKNQLFQKDGATVSTINYGDLSGSLVFTDGPATFTIDVLHYDLVGTFDPIIPAVRYKAVLENYLLWVMSPTRLSVLDSYNLRTVTTFTNITPISFALDVLNSVLYLATSTGLYTSSYSGGSSPTLSGLTQATLNGSPITYTIVDMAASADTLYFTTSSGTVNSLPLSAINGNGSLTTVTVTDADGNALVARALTFAHNFGNATNYVYVSANTGSTGTLIRLGENLTVIERNSFPPNATQIMLNRGSIVYAAIGDQLWANDYVHLNKVPGDATYHAPVTNNADAVTLASNVNYYLNDTTIVQENYVVVSNGNIYKINHVLQDVMGIELVQMYPATSEPPPSVTINSMSTVTDILTLLGSNSASAVLAAALSGGVTHAVILLAFAEYAAINGTAIFSSYAGSALAGVNLTISAANAASLYTKLGVTGPAATRDIFISVPNAGVLTLGPTTINTSLAIDDTVTATYSFAGYTGHTLSIASGTQTFTSPSGSSVLSQGSTITLTNSSGTVTYPVLHLDLTLGAGTSTPICFFGNAPVKTPHGYRRMDSLKVGDRVSTPTGSAVIQHIHCQDYAAGPSANPYVIPKGRFGATEDLLISPRHKVAVNGRMVEARDLGLAQQQETGTLTYYNLGLNGANMIVAGVLVESLAPMARMTISRAEFNQILAAKYGGRMTPEIAAACHFDGDRVSVPFRR